MRALSHGWRVATGEFRQDLSPFYYEQAKRRIQNRGPEGQHSQIAMHIEGTGAQSEGKGLPNQWRVLDNQACVPLATYYCL
jgi:hypothetical protein